MKKLKNISVKPLCVGTMDILPGEEKAFPPDMEAHPVIDLYVKLGLIEVSEDAKKSRAAKKAAPEEPAAADA